MDRTADGAATAATGQQPLDVLLEPVLSRLDRIEFALSQLVAQPQDKEWYTPAEAARILGKQEYTVREWCRHGRIAAEKKSSGRGKFHAWVISRDELKRFEREGLLPSRN